MTKAEIIQIILSSVSLVCTVVISFLVYCLQRRHEKAMRKIEDDRRREQLENEATKFLIENELEKAYLPWCVIAANVNRHRNHSRAIYTNFSACTETLQKEILRQAGFDLPLIGDSNWVQNSFEMLRKDINKYKLCDNGMDFLYDGAKYFHYAFEYLGAEDYEPNTRSELCIFDNLYKQNAIGIFRSDYKVGVSRYIESYFDYILGSIPDDNLAVKNPIPPIKYIIDTQDLHNADEQDLVYWVMEYVENIIVNIHNRFRDRTLVMKNKTDAEVKTFEDSYYHTLFWLYATYQNSVKKER